MVAGIVVGTVALILAIAVLVYMWRRRSYPAVNLMQGTLPSPYVLSPILRRLFKGKSMIPRI